MSQNDDEKDQLYKVVINEEEQYSFWPVYKNEIPLGWRDTGFSGTKSECGAYVCEVWTDMRPLSLRKHMEKVKEESIEKTQITEFSAES